MDKKDKNLEYSLLRNVINQMPDVFILKDKDGKFVLCNETLANFYNTTPDEMVGRDDRDFGVPKEMADFFRENIQDIIARGKTEIVYEDSRDAQSGEIRHFKSIKKPIKNEKGEDQVIVIAQDMTELINLKNRAEEGENRLSKVLEVIGEGLWDWDIGSGEVKHNKEWGVLLGFEEGAVCGTVEEFSSLLYEEDRKMVMQRIQELLDGKVSRYESTHRMVDKQGNILFVKDRGVIARYDEDGKPAQVIGSFRDITEQLKAQEEVIAKQRLEERHKLLEKQAELLHTLAVTDNLTGLKNRSYCEEAMANELHRFERMENHFSILLLDLDFFKRINDTFGHDVGDLTLVKAAETFQKLIRKSDMVGRWGGEEFLIVCPDTSLTGAEELAQKICRHLAKEDFPKVGQVCCSIGVTSSLKGDDKFSLLKRADRALYDAKKTGRNRVVVGL